MFKKVIILVTMLSAATAAIAQQQQVSFGLPDPAPAWPADGVIPAELKTKYVFIDASKNEFVIAYPENLGKPEFEKEPGTLRIARYELLREVAPSVAVSISPAGSTYKYTYAVANGKTAKQSIDQFTIVAPEPVADSINRPDGWFSVIQ
ncbi:MAG: hypothetical protein HY646_06815, partial [Acidobacteria bacterium]|nr:hypothetical protein [Acidobacteriota bacterium]